MGGFTPEPPLQPPPSAREVPWGVLDSIGAFLLQIVVLVVVVATVGLVRPQSTASIVLLPVSLLVLAGSALLWVQLRYPGCVGRLFGRVRPRLADAGLGLGIGVLAFLVITLGLGFLLQLLVRALGGPQPEVQQQFRQFAANAATAPLFAVSAALVAPFAEELFFRGMLYPALRKRIRVWPGIVISALAFALAHASQSPSLTGKALIVAVILPLGMMLAWLYERRGTIIAPMLAHSVYNLIQVVLLLLGLDQFT